MKNLSSAIWGLIFILVGIVLATNALDITSIDIFFDGWWTLFIIVPSFIGLIKENNKVGSVIWLGIGIVLFLAARDIISWSIISKLSFPLLVVFVRACILTTAFTSRGVAENLKDIKAISLKESELAAIFSGQKTNYDNQEFKGIELNAVFGGIELDLRNAKIKKDQVIEASAIFGGIDITVPENVNVVVKSIGIFGGTSNKVSKKDSKAVTLYVESTAIFGGVEIK